MEQGNVPKPWSDRTQALPPTQLTSGRKRNGAGREWRPGTTEHLLCSSALRAQTYISWCFHDTLMIRGLGKLRQEEYLERLRFQSLVKAGIHI